MKWIDKLLGRSELRKRNDQLVCANRRLGLEILALRKMKMPKVPRLSGKQKDLKSREDVLEVRKYKMRIESQRQHVLVNELRKHLDADTFLAIARRINLMSDEEVMGHADDNRG